MVMSKIKLRYFDIKPKTNKYLTWSLVAYLFVSALIAIGDFIGFAHVSDGSIVYGISRITQSGVGKVLLSLVSTGFLVSIWEMFRRSLKNANSMLWYFVLALMTLMVCDFLVSIIPDGGDNVIQQLQHPSRFDTFATRFKNVSAGVQSILQIILSISLLVKFRGRISAFGWSTLICMILTGVFTGWIYTYIYNNVTGLVPFGLSLSFVVVRYLLVAIPVVFLRRTMDYRNIHEASASNDIE